MSLSSDRADIIQTAYGLRPVQLEARFDWWRRGGISGQAGEMVSRSRGLPMPAFDGGDRTINAAEKAYNEALEGALAHLRRAWAIEKTWLVVIHVATDQERAQASDLGVDCLCCNRPVACTPVDPIREGFCDACSKAWRRAGKPDRVRFIKERRAWLEMPEAAEG